MCLFRRLTGHRCPLCGLTTATGHLLHSEWRAALRAHRLAPLIWLMAGAWFIHSAAQQVRGTLIRSHS
jgi:hypothetical protein